MSCVYYFVCRYQRAQQDFKLSKMKDDWAKLTEMRGTEEEAEWRKKMAEYLAEEEARQEKWLKYLPKFLKPTNTLDQPPQETSQRPIQQKDSSS